MATAPSNVYTVCLSANTEGCSCSCSQHNTTTPQARAYTHHTHTSNCQPRAVAMATKPLLQPVEADGERVIPASRRPDGTLRKERRIREGYTPQDEQPVYQPKPALVGTMP